MQAGGQRPRDLRVRHARRLNVRAQDLCPLLDTVLRGTVSHTAGQLQTGAPHLCALVGQRIVADGQRAHRSKQPPRQPMLPRAERPCHRTRSKTDGSVP
jgi:hypothetical protein